MKRARSYSPTADDADPDDSFMALLNLGEDTDAPAATTMPDMAPADTNMPAVPEVAPATNMPAVPEVAPATTMPATTMPAGTDALTEMILPHGTHPPDVDIILNAELHRAAMHDGLQNIEEWIDLVIGWSNRVHNNPFATHLHADLEQWRLEAGCLASAMVSTTLNCESWQQKYNEDFTDYLDLAVRFNGLKTVCSCFPRMC